MADPTITGRLPGSSESFEFNINGLATQKSMERLIHVTEALAKRLKAKIDKEDPEDKKRDKTTKDRNKVDKEALDTHKDLNKSWEDLTKITKNLKYGWKESIRDMGGWTASIAGATGFLVGSLVGYADNLSGAMKMGVSGQIMDFAVSSKVAGVSMEAFTKALAETGGAFASLGTGATDGAKNFASLVSNVRSATASVGNLGMSNAEMAMFTAQQTKLAVSQGFKGRAAQDLVIKNSQYLGKELDNLANRTGKNVLEMAAAAAKLASDPIVSTFVKSAQTGSAQVSSAVQSFAASLNAQFGEVGGALAADSLKAALGGLPFAVTQSGKNMMLASQTTYTELERQAQKAKRGEKITDEDRKKLNDTVLQEVAARGDQLRMLANLEGQTGESARQLLTMASAAEAYNSEESHKRRQQDKSAQEFNAAIKQFQANLEALAIPFIKLINGINWTLFVNVLGGAIDALEFLLTPLSWLGSILGDTGIGTVIGGLLGLAGVVAFAIGSFGILKKSASSVADVFDKLKIHANEYVKHKEGFVGPVVPQKNKVGQLLDTLGGFKKEIIGTGVALAGLGIAAIGRKLLEEDENSMLGSILEKGGKFVEVLGVIVPIMSGLSALWTAFGPAIAIATKSVVAWGVAIVEQLGITSLLSTAWAKLILIPDLLAVKFRALALATMINVNTMSAVIAGFAATAWTTISGFAAAAVAFMAPLLPFIAIGAAIVGVGYLIYKNWDSIVQAGKDLYDWLATAASKVWDFITAPFKMLADWFKNSWLGKMFGAGDKKDNGQTLTKEKATKTGASASATGWSETDEAVYQQAKAAGATGGTTYSKSFNTGYKPATVPDLSATPVEKSRSGYGKELVNTQSNAIDQNKVKDAENANLQKKQVALLEEINGTNNAQLGVQSRSASAQDNSNRYLKTLSLTGTA